MFVGIVSDLVHTGNPGFIAMINTPIVVVSDARRTAVIYSACIVPYGSDKLVSKISAIRRSSPWGRLLMEATPSSMVEASLGEHNIPPLSPCRKLVRIVYNPKHIVHTAHPISHPSRSPFTQENTLLP